MNPLPPREELWGWNWRCIIVDYYRFSGYWSETYLFPLVGCGWSSRRCKMCSSLKLLLSTHVKTVGAELKAYLLGLKKGAECLFSLFLLFLLVWVWNTFGCCCNLWTIKSIFFFDTTHFMKIWVLGLNILKCLVVKVEVKDWFLKDI